MCSCFLSTPVWLYFSLCSFYVCIFGRACHQTAPNLLKETTSAFAVFAWFKPQIWWDESGRGISWPILKVGPHLISLNTVVLFVLRLLVSAAEAAEHHMNSWCPPFLKWTKKAFSHIAVCLMVESDSPSGYKTGFNPFIPIIQLAPKRHFILSSKN